MQSRIAVAGSARRFAQRDRGEVLRSRQVVQQRAVPRHGDPAPIDDDDARALRLTARRTWRFFETFVTAGDHALPPDNFQEDPIPTVAHLTVMAAIRGM